MPEAARSPSPEPATLEALRNRILDFVAACRQPVLKEEDAEPLAIAPDRFQLQEQNGALLLETWDERRTVARRVIGIRSTDDRGIVLVVRKFGGREGEVVIVDTAMRGAALDRNLRRKNFRERFRALLARQFPGWTIEKLSSDRDLRRSLSEHYVRALVVRGQSAWAAIGVSEAESETAAAGILTDGILWLDLLRTSTAGRTVSGLCLFVPEKPAVITARRLAFLDPARASYQLFPMPSSDAAETSVEPLAPLDPANCGNLSTELRPPRLTAAVVPDARDRLREIAAFPGVEEEITPQGELSLRFRGLEVAHANTVGVTVIEASMPKIARIRTPDSPDRRSPLYTRSPERWMESLLKTDVSPLALEVAGSPVYSQILSEAGRSRGIMDLLSITNRGRLVVIELKADEDPRLPLQALDYWMRVRWHLARGDFQQQGFFPGRDISAEPPLLWLVFPAIRQHAANETVLKYFSRQVPVTRLGVNEDWRKGIRVVSRG
jgi:hypothetical protein